MTFTLVQCLAMTLPLTGFTNINECGDNITPDTMQNTCQFTINTQYIAEPLGISGIGPPCSQKYRHQKTLQLFKNLDLILK